jgi:hypothetical protein
MNANALAGNYGRLTPEECFRLILAAGARGDKAEQDRLVNAGGRITFSTPDHTPYARAFDELAKLTFLELLEEAARYDDAWARAGDAEAEEGEVAEAEDEPDGQAGAGPAEDEGGERPAWQGFFDLALAAGFVLRTKAAGWQLFCGRLSVPPFALWQELPGFGRLQLALKQAEQAAFAPEGMLRWLNGIRPAGHPEVQELGLTPERYAAGCEAVFRQRARWWGGERIGARSRADGDSRSDENKA